MAECELSDKKCIPCAGGVPPLKGEELRTIHEQLGADWNLVEDHHIDKEYVFDDFLGALKFTNK
ncbi:MAG TPA: 4a-hydroxytetrahydrobiopterin dehydratase, partial [Spirochaetes bacterium]|nr:4a-hydroxytetrahydrobiopterin dehydratase [Spirochaetota bacterium]